MTTKGDQELTIYRCKVDSKRFVDFDELVSHLTDRHSQSFKVQRVADPQNEAVKVEDAPQPEKKKRGRPKKVKIEDIITSTFRTNFPTAQVEPVTSQ
ncbi:MAG: hypothetical protein ACYC7D_03480 [Nitrososphaerales archaeon]